MVYSFFIFRFYVSEAGEGFEGVGVRAVDVLPFLKIWRQSLSPRRERTGGTEMSGSWVCSENHKAVQES